MAADPAAAPPDGEAAPGAADVPGAAAEPVPLAAAGDDELPEVHADRPTATNSAASEVVDRVAMRGTDMDSSCRIAVPAAAGDGFS
jgi:hypothetical protein